jgi:hypothetical protein
MNEDIRITNFTCHAKMFVGLFTMLMLCVCGWAVLILYVERGMISESEIPSYVKQPYGPADTSTVKEKPAEQKPEQNQQSAQRRLKHNVKLAHTHINGQTLLFFAMGLVFLFTSVKPKVKKIIFCAFAVSVVVHNIGLTGENYHWIYDEMVAVSGVLILVSIAYMAFVIYADLLRNPDKSGQAVKSE